MRIVVPTIAALALCCGCASHTPSNVDPFVFKPGVVRHEESGFVVGVEFYGEREAVEQVFHRDLAAKGYLVLRLRLANQTDERFVLPRTGIVLVDSAGSRYQAVPGEDVSEVMERNTVGYALFGFGSWSAKSVEDANDAMREDWESIELPESALIGGHGSQTGFVFFGVPDGALSAGSTLELGLESFIGARKSVLSIPLSTP